MTYALLTIIAAIGVLVSITYAVNARRELSSPDPHGWAWAVAWGIGGALGIGLAVAGLVGIWLEYQL